MFMQVRDMKTLSDTYFSRMHACMSQYTGKTPLYSGVRLYDEQDPPLN